MSDLITSVLFAFYSVLVACVVCSITFVLNTAKKMRQQTERELEVEKGELQAEIDRAAEEESNLAAAVAMKATTSAARPHPSSVLSLSGENAPLLHGTPNSHVARVRWSADLKRVDSNESTAGSDGFESVAELEESTEVSTDHAEPFARRS